MNKMSEFVLRLRVRGVRSQHRGRVRAAVVPWVFVAVVGVLAGWIGWRARSWAFNQTSSIRHHDDIGNAFNRGSRVLQEARLRAGLPTGPAQQVTILQLLGGWVRTYDRIDAEHPDGEYGLDYPPLRLLVMSLWVRHVQTVDPAITAWTPNRQFIAFPLLVFNALCAAAAAVGMFLLVFHWTRRGEQPIRHNQRSGDLATLANSAPFPYRPWLCALLASLLVWFDPTVVTVSHVWPQWDVWILPFFIAAALLASLESWFAAGLMIGVGCLLKGQLLLGSPVLLLWPIFSGKWGAATRFAIGFALATALLLSPWLISGHRAAGWVGCVLLAGELAAIARAKLRATPPASPWVLVNAKHMYRRVAVAAGAIWTGAVLFGGSFSWLHVGFEYGARRNTLLNPCPGSFCSLTAILYTRFGCSLHDPIARFSGPFLGPQGFQLDLKGLLAIVYLAALLLCAFGASVHARRNDPRLLLALAAPWVIFPLIMGEMGSRYLLWAAALTSAAVAVSAGMTLLHLLLTIAATAMTLQYLCRKDTQFAPGLHAFFSYAYPGMSWMMLLLAAIYLYIAVAPAGGRRGSNPRGVGSG